MSPKELEKWKKVDQVIFLTLIDAHYLTYVLNMTKTLPPWLNNKSPKSNRLPCTLRTLMDARQINGKQLAKAVGISPTSISKILKGKTTPRPTTFKRIKKVLCQNKDEGEYIENARSPFGLSLEPEPATSKESKAYIQARLELAKRARHHQFQQSIGKQLEQVGVAAKQNYVLGNIHVDYMIEFTFMVEHDGSEAHGYIERSIPVPYQIALICHADLKAGLDKSNTIAQLLRESSLFDEVILIVPYEEDTPYRYAPGRFNPVLNERGAMVRIKSLSESSIDPEAYN